MKTQTNKNIKISSQDNNLNLKTNLGEINLDFNDKEVKVKGEFSKKILLVVGSVTLIVTIVSCVLSFMTKSVEIFQYLIPAIYAELAVGTGFYYNKAKAENKYKILLAAKKDGIDIPEEFIMKN